MKGLTQTFKVNYATSVSLLCRQCPHACALKGRSAHACVVHGKATPPLPCNWVKSFRLHVDVSRDEETEGHAKRGCTRVPSEARFELSVQPLN